MNQSLSRIPVVPRDPRDTSPTESGGALLQNAEPAAEPGLVPERRAANLDVKWFLWSDLWPAAPVLLMFVAATSITLGLLWFLLSRDLRDVSAATTTTAAALQGSVERNLRQLGVDGARVGAWANREGPRFDKELGAWLADRRARGLQLVSGHTAAGDFRWRLGLDDVYATGLPAEDASFVERTVRAGTAADLAYPPGDDLRRWRYVWVYPAAEDDDALGAVRVEVNLFELFQWLIRTWKTATDDLWLLNAKDARVVAATSLPDVGLPYGQTEQLTGLDDVAAAVVNEPTGVLVATPARLGITSAFAWRRMRVAGQELVLVRREPYFIPWRRAVGPVLLTLLSAAFAIGAAAVAVRRWLPVYSTRIAGRLQDEAMKNLNSAVEARTVELRFVGEMVREMLDAIPSGLLMLNQKYQILLVNRSFYTLVNPKHASVVNRHLGEILPATFKPLCDAVFDSRQAVRDREVRFAPEGAQEKILRVSILHLPGKRDRILMVLDDQTDRMMMESQLIQAEKMAGLGITLSGIAHEINNPLNAIAGLAQIVQIKPDVTPEIKDLAGQMHAYTRRAAEIVKELSRYSRSNMLRDFSIADIHQIIDEGLNLVQHSRKLGDTVVEKRFTPTLPKVRVRPTEIEQVVINLLTNALDAIEERRQAERAKGVNEFRGAIRITTGLYKGEYVQIQVQDTGNGIAPEKVGLIFDPFFTTKEQGKGTGLGLSITYKILNRHGGTIFVDSVVGEGTTFTIRLPIRLPDGAAPAAKA